MLGQGPRNRRLGGQTGPRLVPTPDTAPSCPGTPRAPPLGPRSSTVPPPPGSQPRDPLLSPAKVTAPALWDPARSRAFRGWGSRILAELARTQEPGKVVGGGGAAPTSAPDLGVRGKTHARAQQHGYLRAICFL